MRIGGVLTLVVVLSLVAGSLNAQARAELPRRDVERINEASEIYSKAVLARDWKAVAELFAEDGVFYPPEEAAVKGRAAIQACFDPVPPLTNFTRRNLRVDGRDDIAYVQGTYLMTLASPDGSEPVQRSGYYLEIRRRQPDGRWLIAVEMLSTHR